MLPEVSLMYLILAPSLTPKALTLLGSQWFLTVLPNVRAERTPEACCVSPTCEDRPTEARRAYAACRRRSARARG
jgi:hypothetical protein